MSSFSFKATVIGAVRYTMDGEKVLLLLSKNKSFVFRIPQGSLDNWVAYLDHIEACNSEAAVNLIVTKFIYKDGTFYFEPIDWIDEPTANEICRRLKV